MKKLPGMLALGIVGMTVAVSAELYHRAPDVLPGTLPEMRTTDYWIQKMAKPDEVILTPDAIEKMNQAYEEFIRQPNPFQGQPRERIPSLSYYWPGNVNYAPDLKAMTPRAIADTVRSRIQIEIKHMRGKPFGNILAVEYRPQDLDRFEQEMAMDKVSDTLKIRPAIAVRCTQLRNVPSFHLMNPGITENAKTRWDQWNIGIVSIGMPLTVLHSSRTGEYLFAICDNRYGWVRSEDIAFGSEKAIRDFVKAKDFVVCTGDRVQFFGDKACTFASGFFRMGDCLPLASRSNPRQIKIPMRKMNGDFYTETAWLADDNNTHVGWLPYTRRNIVTTAFKLLDNHYDWTGAWFGRQHETTYRDIFAVFGFRLPWHGGLFTFFGKNTEVMPSKIGKENQYKEILRHEPFLTIQSCGGHAQLLFGDYNGMPIVFDQHGYGYKDESGKDIEIRRCCIGDMTQPSYFLTRNVTFLELK
jgi:hypothetical protein